LAHLQCDGQPICARCKDAGEQCKYNYIRQESKDKLRARNAELQKSSTDSDALLRALASIADPHVCKAVLQGLIDGTISPTQVLGEFSPAPESGTSSSAGRLSQATPQPPASPPSPSTSCFEQLLSWRSCRPVLKEEDVKAVALEAASVQPPVLSLPVLPLDAYTSQAQEDSWTGIGWTRAHTRHLVDALRTWDHLPFCLLSEDLFWQDYASGSTRFCSSALVHAILALSTRLINERGDNAAFHQSGWPGSRFFLDKAKAILKDTKAPKTLPDIQALGMFSLYSLRCGRETEAQTYAELFATSISDLHERSLVHAEDEAYAESLHTSYSGAISLIR
jgi:hypothetical protein